MNRCAAVKSSRRNRFINQLRTPMIGSFRATGRTHNADSAVSVCQGAGARLAAFLIFLPVCTTVTASTAASAAGLVPYSRKAMDARMAAAAAKQQRSREQWQLAAASTEPQLPLLFAQVGKAGGGTIRLRLANMAVQHKFSRCPPRPCLHTALQRLALQHHNLDAILINVRDPVDRFLSAFNWRNIVLCNRSASDTRVPVSKGKGSRAWEQPGQYCKVESAERSRITAYGGNPNRLAEGLCYTLGKRLEYTAAHRTVKVLGHAQDSLTAHLGGDAMFAALVAEASTQIAVIPLEPGFNFTDLIDSAVQSILPAATFHPVVESADALARMAHSSVAAQANAEGVRAFRLSPKGTCCLVQHYKTDYAAILKLAEVGCRGRLAGHCKEALFAMYDRRQSMCSALPSRTQ